MSRYDVYAIGNALVDYEFEVSVAELSRLGISKSVMTVAKTGRWMEMSDSFMRSAAIEV